MSLGTYLIYSVFPTLLYGVQDSDGSVNSRLWKIYARKQCLAFHGITFHFGSELQNSFHTQFPQF